MTHIMVTKLIEVDGGDVVLDLTEELCKKLGWEIGDELTFTVKGESIIIEKLNDILPE